MSDKQMRPQDAQPESRDLMGEIIGASREAIDSASDAYRETFETILKSLPSFEEIIAQAVRAPGASVSRSGFIAESVGRKHPNSVVHAAIETTPARAGISSRELNQLAKASIGKDGRRTTLISFAAGIPGGVAAAASVPADLIQFYAHLIVTVQKLSYLYGWRDLVRISDQKADRATTAALIMFLGVMSGIEKANQLLDRLAHLRSAGANDDGLRAVLAGKQLQGDISDISNELSRRMASRIAGQVAGKAVPVVGGVISGVLTGSGYSDMAGRLHKQLKRYG